MSHKCSTALCMGLVMGLLFTLSVQAMPTETSIAVRAPGTVAEFFDQEELVKRWSANTGMSILSVAGVFAALTCKNPLVLATASWACLASLAGVVIGGIVGVIGDIVGGSKMRRDLDELAKYGPPVVENYNFMQEHLATGKPVVMRYHDCYGSGCYQAEYSIHTTASGKQMHRILGGPRQKNNGSNHPSKDAKERSYTYNQYGGYYEDTYDGSDTRLYFDYIFENLGDRDDDASDALFLNYNSKYSDLESTFELATDVGYVYDNGPGYYCYNLFVGPETYENNNQMTTGYAGIFQDYMEQDPDNEASYIQTCSDLGRGGEYQSDNYGRKR